MLPCFHQNLARLRRLKKVNQREAAAELGVSQALLSHYEKGLREPGMEFLCRAAEYYGVSADYLLGRTADMTGGRHNPEAESAALKSTDTARRTAARLRLHKAELQELVGTVYDLMDRLELGGAEPAAYTHIRCELYRLLVLLHLSGGRGSRCKDLFMLPRSYIDTAAEGLRREAEREMVLHSLKAGNDIRSDAPAMSAEVIEQELGERGQSLVREIREVAELITNYVEGAKNE